MRTLVLAAMAAVLAAAPAGAAQDGKAKPHADRRDSGRQVYDFDRFLDEKHPFPGTYATPSRTTGKRPGLPRRDVGPDGEPGTAPQAAEAPVTETPATETTE